MVFACVCRIEAGAIGETSPSMQALTAGAFRASGTTQMISSPVDAAGRGERVEKLQLRRSGCRHDPRAPSCSDRFAEDAGGLRRRGETQCGPIDVGFDLHVPSALTHCMCSRAA